MCLPKKDSKNKISEEGNSSNFTSGKDFPGTEEDKTQREGLDNEDKRLNAVYKAMGVDANSAMAIKLEQDKKKEKVDTKMEKYGDIGFNLASRVETTDGKKTPPTLQHESSNAQDDTQYEMKKKTMMSPLNPFNLFGKKKEVKPKKKGQYSYRKKDGGGDTPRGDVDFDPPNETNFMANLKDIEYVAHEMVRTMTLKQMPKHSTGSGLINPWDDLNNIDRDARFSWNSFKSNTFLSNALSLPTHQERDHLNTADDERKNHVVWIIPAMDIARFKEDDVAPKTCRSLVILKLEDSARTGRDDKDAFQ